MPVVRALANMRIFLAPCGQTTTVVARFGRHRRLPGVGRILQAMARLDGTIPLPGHSCCRLLASSSLPSVRRPSLFISISETIILWKSPKYSRAHTLAQLLLSPERCALLSGWQLVGASLTESLLNKHFISSQTSLAGKPTDTRKKLDASARPRMLLKMLTC